MEHLGGFFDEEFDFLKMFINVDGDFLMSDIPDENLSQNFGISPPSFFQESTDNHMLPQNFYLQSFDTLNINSYVSQESSNSSGSENQVYFPNGSCEDNQDNNVNSFLTLTNDNNGQESMEFFAMDNQNENSFVRLLSENDNIGDNNVVDNAAHQGVTTMKRKFDADNEKSLCNNNDSFTEDPKKKPRAPRNTQKSKKTNGGQSKKNKKILEDNISNANEDKNNENTENDGKKIQSPSSPMSEDDSNASQESNVGECKESSVQTSKGKTRATRGNATDPQSLYARKRRERINERLRILQTLVPNGTKVDISTMLEEAVQYVKFLQLQIQLLGSDELWMFAPLAYNGIDVGVYQRMFPTL